MAYKTANVCEDAKEFECLSVKYFGCNQSLTPANMT